MLFGVNSKSGDVEDVTGKTSRLAETVFMEPVEVFTIRNGRVGRLRAEPPAGVAKGLVRARRF